MEADWDLQAVVRGCCSAATTTATVVTTAPADGYKHQKSTFYGEDNTGILTFSPDLIQTRSNKSIYQFMDELYNLQDPPYHHHQISPFSFLIGHQDPPYHHHNHRQHQQQQQEKQFQVKHESLGVSRCTTLHAHGTTKIKKRKNQIKKVCQVAADGSSPDLWSWRKYGQKPIKGSPYPRGYYRCSTLKGCSARKQVERNRSDPGMLIITYTGEHTHPLPAQVNSLAGVTRNKTPTARDNNTGNKPSPSSPVSPAASFPPVPEKMDESLETEKYDTDDDNNFDISSVVIDEDTFDGLDELVGSVVGDIYSDHHAPSKPAPAFPWLSNNLTTTTTTAAGGS